MSDLDRYDAGLLGGGGGGDVGWWHDYLRAELDRAHDHYAAQIAAAVEAEREAIIGIITDFPLRRQDIDCLATAAMRDTSIVDAIHARAGQPSALAALLREERRRALEAAARAACGVKCEYLMNHGESEMRARISAAIRALIEDADDA